LSVLPPVPENKANSLSMLIAVLVLASPDPLGVAHVPSPRQYVALEALVPLFRFATGKLPVTPVVRLTLVIVLLPPLIVLLVSVCVSDVPTTLPEGAVLPAKASRSGSYACTVTPMAVPAR
jgi:hypothetical protein